MGIAAGQVVWVRLVCVACVALCHGDCCWAGRVGGALPCGSARRVCGVGGAVPWGLLLGVSRGGPKRLHFKYRACTESSFVGFATGPAV